MADRTSKQLNNVSARIDELTDELEALKIQKQALRGKARREVKKKQLTLLVDEYFDNKSELDIIQEICDNLLGEHGESISQCKKLLRGTYINIFDYVQGDYRTFSTIGDLRRRCQEIGFYNRDKAKNHNLKHLLVALTPSSTPKQEAEDD